MENLKSLDEQLFEKNNSTQYVNAIANKERSCLKEYENLTSNRKKNKYVNNLLKNEEYFLAYKVITNNKYRFDLKTSKKIINCTNNFLEKLFKDNVQDLIPIYVINMYQMAGLKNDKILTHLKNKINNKNYSNVEKKEFFEWHPFFKNKI